MNVQWKIDRKYLNRVKESSNFPCVVVTEHNRLYLWKGAHAPLITDVSSITIGEEYS